MNRVVEQILNLIPKILIPPNKDLTEIRLERDLGIYGDDAAEFIQTYSKKFNVDISNFDFSEQFTHETMFYTLRKYIFGIHKKDLSIKDLENGIKIGKLK